MDSSAFDDANFPPMIDAIKQGASIQELRRAGRDRQRLPASRRRQRLLPRLSDIGRVSRRRRAEPSASWAKVRAATGLVDPRATPDGSFDPVPADWDVEGPKLVATAEALFRTKSTAEWGSLLEQHGVPSGPVHFIEELFEHPQATENGLVTEMDHPLLGHMKMVGPAFQMSGTPLAAQGPSPVLGGDTALVLREAGYTADEIEAMTVAGVIGVA